MRKALLLMVVLVVVGCDGLPWNPITAIQKGAGAPDFATEAEVAVKKALDDWVFGDANYKLDSNAGIRFGDVDYNMGDPLTSYEIVATKEIGPTWAEVAVRLVFPTRGGVHEIKKSVSYSVWKTEEGYWQIGMAIDVGVKRAVSVEN